MSSPESTVLVTGAAGKTGRSVVRALSGAGFAVRAVVRRSAQLAAVEELGAGGSVVADLLDAEALAAAARGVDSVYHICPNVHPQEVAIGRNAIAPAKAAGVRRFIFHSVLHPMTEEMPHHWAKMRVEEALLGSGLDVTVLQPAPYMQNLLGQWAAVVDEGVYRVPYALESRVVMVDLEDVAAAAAGVLVDPGHIGATYQLCGPDLLDQRQIADEMGRVLGRSVRAEATPIDQWREGARAAGLDEGRIDTLTRMFRYYERHGMAGSPATLQWLLERRPVRFQGFLRRQVAGHPW